MTEHHTVEQAGGIGRFLPLASLALAIALAWALGLHNYLSFQSLAENQSLLEGFVARNLLLAMLVYVAVYIVVVALSLPGAAILSITGGFVFGWLLSAPMTIVAATIGAMLVFNIVQTSLGATIAARAGPFVQKLSDGFSKDAFNYLLFLRLVPAFPFFAVNAVAGLTKMKLRSFALATAIGIIPGSFAFAWLGRGLGSVIEAQRAAQQACKAADASAPCPFDFTVSSLVTPQLLAAFVALGLVALVPLALKRLKK